VPESNHLADLPHCFRKGQNLEAVDAGFGSSGQKRYLTQAGSMGTLSAAAQGTCHGGREGMVVREGRVARGGTRDLGRVAVWALQRTHSLEIDHFHRYMLLSTNFPHTHLSPYLYP